MGYPDVVFLLSVLCPVVFVVCSDYCFCVANSSLLRPRQGGGAKGTLLAGLTASKQTSTLNHLFGLLLMCLCRHTCHIILILYHIILFSCSGGNASLSSSVTRA